MSFSPNWFWAKRAQKKDELKEAQDLSQAPYDRWKYLIKKKCSPK